MIIQRFNLNLIPNQSPVIVHVNQYDTGTGRLVATLYEGNEPYSPSGTAVIQGTKPDGHGFQYAATLDGNVVTADLTEQMSPVAGDVRAQIVVTESSGVTGTFVFIISVQPSALPSDTDMSESDYQYIEEAIREAQEAVQTAQEATETAQEAVERAQEAISETRENAEDSEAWAQGTRGGIPVEPTDPTYEHNAEYWAQYAERYAQGGLHYKASIPFADIPTTGMREGDMYDITDDFTTDSRFTEGAGIKVKGGTNIAWNSDNKWDILALPYIPKTTFNGRSGSILPMAGDYDSEKILLSSALHIGGETQNDVQEALEALSDDGVKSFNGRSGSVLPMAGDYDSEKILLASVLHIGGETQDNVQKALEALEGNKADKVDNAVADNFAGLDADGNLKDSGKKASDFATPSNIDDIKSYLGILTTPVPSYVANTLPVLKRNITSAFYNGSLRGEIAAGNFKNVRPGDYIIGQATGSTYYVAMCDYRLGKGDQTNNANYPAYGTHHLGLILFKPVGTTALWRGYGNADKSWRVSAADLGRCPWNAATDADPTNTEAVGTNNTNITRTYNGANVSGYMGSFIRERIDAILLPQCFQADFGSANVLKYREINGNAVATDKPSGGQGNWNGCTSGWTWYDRYLDLPSEIELYGSRIFGSGLDHGCQCEQLSIFRNAAIHDFFPRIDIWLKGVASSSVACYRNYYGVADGNGASRASWACPLACVK